MAVASVQSAQSTRRFHAAAAVTSRLLRPEGSAALHASLWSARGVPEARTCNEEARRRKEEPAQACHGPGGHTPVQVYVRSPRRVQQRG